MGREGKGMREKGRERKEGKVGKEGEGGMERGREKEGWMKSYDILFIYLFIFYWSGFCHTLTWISHGVTCIPHPNPPSHLPHFKCCWILTSISICKLSVQSDENAIYSLHHNYSILPLLLKTILMRKSRDKPPHLWSPNL